MEDLQTRLNKLTDTSKYRLKANLVKEILEEFKMQMSKENTFHQAIAIDEKHHPVHVTHEHVLKIIDEFIALENLNVKYTPNMIVDGYRKPCC
ncbi:MAG: hypothetical protein IJ867_07790 [Clostridia bacterium]|nr:hypothetical protein [Clostridia bacterium]